MRILEVTDAEIIEASIDDPARFGDLFERHYPPIRRYLHRRVGAELAKDLASETFAIAFAKRAGFKLEREDARPWLYGIAANLLHNHRRGERRQLLAYAKTGVDPVDDPSSDAIDDRIDARARGPAIAEALASLQPEWRETLLLYAWAELTYEEIAQALEVPVGTVRSRISRSRERLRAHLQATEQQVQAKESEHE